MGRRMMRVLLVCGDMHPSSGGPPVVVAEVAIELRRLGHWPEVLGTCTRGTEQETERMWPGLHEVGVPIHLFPRVGPTQLSFSPRQELFTRRRLHDFDIVNIHGIWGHSLCSVARKARQFSIPYVVTVHGMLDHWSRRRSSRKKAVAKLLFGTEQMLAQAGALHYGTADEANEASDLGYAAPVFTIANGIDLSARRQSSERDREALLQSYPELAERWPIVLFFARIHPKKGLDLLLEGFAQVADEFPRAALLVAGIKQDVEYQLQIERRLKELALGDRAVITTEFTGAKGRVALELADVLALPSHEEGFSMAILEAMACGLPVLITDRCHLNEVADRGAGVVVAPTISGVTDGLRALLGQTQDELAAMAERARRWVERDYSRTHIVGQVVSMYEQLISTQRNSRDHS